MGLADHRPDNGSIHVLELERFCAQIRENGGGDGTQVFVRSSDGIVFNVNSWRVGHSKGPVLEIESMPPQEGDASMAPDELLELLTTAACIGWDRHTTGVPYTRGDLTRQLLLVPVIRDAVT